MVILHEVQHVLDLMANLVSLGQLERRGVNGSFTSGSIKVLLNGDKLLHAELLSINLYKILLDTHHNNRAAYRAAYITQENENVSLRLWHRHMGHLNYDAIRSEGTYVVDTGNI